MLVEMPQLIIDKKLVIYWLVMAFVVYLLQATMHAVFTPHLEMSKNYCVEWVAPDGETEECYRFRNKFEERKHMHRHCVRNVNVPRRSAWCVKSALQPMSECKVRARCNVCAVSLADHPAYD